MKKAGGGGGGGVVWVQVSLEPRGKSESTVRAAVTHASRASGQWDLTRLRQWPFAGLEEGKQPRKAWAGPDLESYSPPEALFPGGVSLTFCLELRPWTQGWIAGGCWDRGIHSFLFLGV